MVNESAVLVTESAVLVTESAVLVTESAGCSYRISGFGYRISGIGYRIRCFGYRISAFGYRIVVSKSDRLVTESDVDPECARSGAETADWLNPEVRVALGKSIRASTEGLILKNLDSPYEQLGRPTDLGVERKQK